jgi:hypothetical protein
MELKPANEELDFGTSLSELRKMHKTGLESVLLEEIDPEQQVLTFIKGSKSYTLLQNFIKNAVSRKEIDVNWNHYKDGLLANNAVWDRFLTLAFQFISHLHPGLSERYCTRFAILAFMQGPDLALQYFSSQGPEWKNLILPSQYQRPSILYGSMDQELNQWCEYLRNFYYNEISFREDPRTSAHYRPISAILQPGQMPKDPHSNVRLDFPEAKEFLSLAPSPAQTRPSSETSLVDVDDSPISPDPLQPTMAAASAIVSASGFTPISAPGVSSPLQQQQQPQIQQQLDPRRLIIQTPFSVPGFSQFDPLRPASVSITQPLYQMNMPATFAATSQQQQPSQAVGFSFGSFTVASSSQSGQPLMSTGAIPKVTTAAPVTSVSGPSTRDHSRTRFRAHSNPSFQQQQEQQPSDRPSSSQGFDFASSFRRRQQQQQYQQHQQYQQYQQSQQPQQPQLPPRASSIEEINRDFDSSPGPMNFLLDGLSDLLSKVKHQQRSRPPSASQGRRVVFDSPTSIHQSMGSSSPDVGFKPYRSPSLSSPLIRPTPILPKMGIVINPSNAPSPIPMQRRVKINPGYVDPLVQWTRDQNLDPTAAGLVIGLNKSLRRSNREARSIQYKTETIDPSLQRTNIEDFNFNINGRTPEEILGSVFRKTYFEDENARLKTMKAIFQRVVDDPYCATWTKEISLRMLGQFNPRREHVNDLMLSTINTMGALDDVTNPDDPDRVRPPVLGNLAVSDPAIIKELFFQLGMPAGEKYKPGGHRPLHFFLRSLEPRITNMRLCSDSAYSLLLTLLDGNLYAEVQRMQSEKVPFEETWDYIQKISIGQISKDSIEKELTELFKSKPKFLSEALLSIHNLRIKFFNQVRDKKERECMINYCTIQDFRNLVHQYYGESSLAIVDTKFSKAKLVEDRQRKLCESQGMPYKSSFNEIRTLMEIICTLLGSKTTPTRGPSMMSAHSLDLSLVDISSLQASSAPAPANSSSGGSARTPHGSNSNKSRRPNSMQGQSKAPELAMFSREIRNAHKEREDKEANAKKALEVYGSMPSSSFKAPDFTKLVLPIPRSTVRRNRSEVPSICWDTIGGLTCFLCAVKNHFYDECPLYPDQAPAAVQCNKCYGFHASECRLWGRKLMDQVVRYGWEIPPPPEPRQVREGYNGGNIQRMGGNRYPNNNNGNYSNGGFNNNGNRYNGNGNNNRYSNGNGNNGNGNGFQRGNDRRYNNSRGNGNGFGRGRDNGNGNNRDNRNYGYPGQPMPDLGGGARMEIDNSSSGPSPRQGQGVLGNSGVQAPPANVFLDKADVQAPSSN